jgi:hypothetical protein
VGNGGFAVAHPLNSIARRVPRPLKQRCRSIRDDTDLPRHVEENAWATAKASLPTLHSRYVPLVPVNSARFEPGKLVELLEDRGVEDLVQPRENTAGESAVEYSMVEAQAHVDIAVRIRRPIAQ